MDFGKLIQVADGIKSAEQISAKRVVDSAVKKAAVKKATKKEVKKVEDSKKTFKSVKVTDSYKSNYKRIKDALAETESTEAAADASLAMLNDMPAEEAITGVIEVLGEVIDILQNKAEEPMDEPIDEEPEAEAEEVTDSMTVTVENGSESAVVEAGDNGVAEEPIAPIAEPAEIAEPIADEPIAEEPIEGAEEEIPEITDSADDMDKHEDSVFKQIENLLKQGKNEEALKMLNENANLLNNIMGDNIAS